MVKSADAEFKFPGMVDEGLQVWDCIAVDMDMDLAPEHANQRFPLDLSREICLNPVEP
jgi:hypothetical protein